MIFCDKRCWERAPPAESCARVLDSACPVVPRTGGRDVAEVPRQELLREIRGDPWRTAENFSRLIVWGASLLFIHFATTELVPVRIASTHDDRAAFAVHRHDNATAIDDFTTFRDVKPQDVVIDNRVRTEIRIWVASNRIVGAIELAYPRLMRCPAIAAHTVDRDFHLIPLRLIDHGSVFRSSR